MKNMKWLLTVLILLITGSLSAAEKITYYHNDALGSPIAATDANGQLLWKEAYKPFGERLRREDGGSNKTWFTGKQEDEDNGLMYFGARWYDPTIGRFMGIDPVGVDSEDAHTYNRYAYANNNPYKYTDPDGRAVFLIYPIATFVAKELASMVAEAAFKHVTGADIPLSTKSALKKVGKGLVKKGPLKNASGNLDDASQAARIQRHNSPNLTQHAKERMAGSRGDGQTVSIDRVQEAIDKGRITSTRGPVVNRRINAADSASGRGLQVGQDVRTNNVTTVIDKGSRR